ncbi:MAG: alpha/beta hydrolase [Gammaproteobacteria bacterium]
MLIDRGCAYALLLLALAIATGFGGGHALAADDDDAAPGTYYWIGDHRMHLVCQGSGTPSVILEAGLGGTSLDWVYILPGVAQFTRVCSYDRAGYGWSDASPSPRTSEVIAAELDELLETAHVRKPYLMVGHSFGGLITRLFAAQHPEKIIGIVLIDATHEAQDQRFAKGQVNTQITPRPERNFVIANYYQVPDALPEPARRIAQTLAIRPNAVATLYGELRSMHLSLEKMQAWNPRIPDVPLLVMAHDARASATTATARRMADIWMEMQQDLVSRTHHGHFTVIENSGHHIQLDRPDKVLEGIRSIFQQTHEPTRDESWYGAG